MGTIGSVDGITITGNVYCSQVEDFIDLKLIFANFCHILRLSSSLFTKMADRVHLSTSYSAGPYQKRKS